MEWTPVQDQVKSALENSFHPSRQDFQNTPQVMALVVPTLAKPQQQLPGPTHTSIPPPSLGHHGPSCTVLEAEIRKLMEQWEPLKPSELSRNWPLSLNSKLP